MRVSLPKFIKRTSALPPLTSYAFPAFPDKTLWGSTNFENISINGIVKSNLSVEKEVFDALILNNPEKLHLLINILKQGKEFFDKNPSDYLDRLGVKVVGTAKLKRTAIIQLGKPFEYRGIRYTALKLKGVLVPTENQEIPPLETASSRQPSEDLVVKNGVIIRQPIYAGAGVMEEDSAFRQFRADRYFYNQLYSSCIQEEDLTFGIGRYIRSVKHINRETTATEKHAVAYLLTLIVDPDDSRASDSEHLSDSLLNLASGLRRYHEVARHGYPIFQNAKVKHGQLYFVDREDTEFWTEIKQEDRVMYAAIDLMKIFHAFTKAREAPNWHDFLQAYFRNCREDMIVAYSSKEAFRAKDAYLDFQPLFWPEDYQLDPSLRTLIETELSNELALEYISDKF